MIYVIGSGPAGVAATQALLAQALPVTMLDAGFRLDAERTQVVERLRGTDKATWAPDDVAAIKGATADRRGVPLKLAFGSDYPYRAARDLLPVRQHGVHAGASLARGGFSTVWGAAMLPYRQEDIEDWPITLGDLEPHYRAVLEFVGIAGRIDGLSEWFPLYVDRPRELPLSRQARAMLDDMERQRDKLRAANVVFGASRLAVNTTGEGRCVCCGLCMYGCPLGAIFDSSAELPRLTAAGVRYVDGVVVESVEEIGGGVRIRARRTNDGAPVHFDGSHVYMAAGTISTTRILLRSLEAFDTPVTLRDSHYFLFPMLRRRAVRDPGLEELHTLSQLFLEVLDSDISEHTVHVQLYSHNDLTEAAVKNALKPLSRWAPGILRAVLGRLLIGQGYLHSSISPAMRVELKRADAGGTPVLVVSEMAAPAAARARRKLLRKLFGLATCFDAVPLSPLTIAGLPGRGFHSGGTFPMHANPGRFASDTFGRPSGFDRVHIVDASVFPSIPATTITLTVMANAHRIASMHAQF